MNKPAISPVRWNPPKAVASARTLPLRNMHVHPMPGNGPEHVLASRDGHLLTGLDDGRVIDYDPATRHHTVIVNTGGRPLGLTFHPDESLIICDAQRGLLRYSTDGRLETLVSGYRGVPFTFCSNVTVAADGTIYFTHSSRKYNLANWTGDILEHKPTGQLFRFGTDGNLELLIDDLGFANGVTLASDESYLVVAQTVAYDLLKLDLVGDSQGAVTRFGDPIPGMPDNIATGDGGTIWVSIVAPRVPVVDFLLPRSPLLRKALWALPDRLTASQAKTSTAVRVLNPTGAIVYDFAGTHPDFGNPTAVCQVGAKAWMASLPFNALACFDIPTDSGAAATNLPSSS